MEKIHYYDLIMFLCFLRRTSLTFSPPPKR